MLSCSSQDLIPIWWSVPKSVENRIQFTDPLFYIFSFFLFFQSKFFMHFLLSWGNLNFFLSFVYEIVKEKRSNSYVFEISILSIFFQQIFLSLKSDQNHLLYGLSYKRELDFKTIVFFNLLMKSSRFKSNIRPIQHLINNFTNFFIHYKTLCCTTSALCSSHSEGAFTILCFSVFIQLNKSYNIGQFCENCRTNISLLLHGKYVYSLGQYWQNHLNPWKWDPLCSTNAVSYHSHISIATRCRIISGTEIELGPTLTIIVMAKKKKNEGKIRIRRYNCTTDKAFLLCKTAEI